MGAAIDNTLVEQAAFLASSHAEFVPFAFEILQGEQFIETPFDEIINTVLDQVISGKIKRLIINIPPRHGKTLRAVKAFVARGFAVNPKSNFIHTSYSKDLVLDNSVAIRDIINHPDYQRLYPYVDFKEDSTAKGLWRTSAGGGFLAAPAGGGITGFGAGVIGADRFAGCLIIDDPVKPDDARYERKLKVVNQRWENTLKSRLADQATPVIVIMQRIAEGDFTSELLERTGANEDWHHLVLPAYINPDETYTSPGRYIEYDLPKGPLWPVKFTAEQALAAMSNPQWSQRTAPPKGEIFEGEWFGRYSSLPSNIKSWSIYCDTASKTKDYNDYTVFQLWAKTTENHGYLVDQFRDRVQVPFLKDRLIAFHKAAIKEARGMKVSVSIEDKDSGVGLIQSLRLEKFEVNAITRKDGKVSRAVSATPNVLHGQVFLPVGVIGDSVIAECIRFKADDSHNHDDQVDCLVDFINYQLPKPRAIDPKPLPGMY